MAKPPKCRICGMPHWGNQPHDFGDAKPAAKPPLRPKATSKPALPESGGDALKAYLEAERKRKADYMREYRKTHPRKK